MGGRGRRSSPLVVGADGARAGWVAVFADAAGVRSVELFADFAALLDAAAATRVVGVDMPVGLLPAGWRDCDAAARAALGSRASTVFFVPPRPAIEAADYDAARRICRELTGKALSKQAYNLAAKILEVDRFAKDDRIVEIHPELSFAAMAGAPLPPKRSYAGVRARLEALEAAGLALPAAVGAAGAAGVDDVLDAAAVAWSARRFAAGEARPTPAEIGQRDGERPLVIWA